MMEENKNENPQIAQQLMVLKIIVFALVMGCVLYAIYAISARQGQQQAGNFSTKLGAVFAAVMVILKLFLPEKMVLSQNSQKNNIAADVSPRELAMGKFMTKTIIACALLEGAVFYNIFLYQSGGSLWSLGIAGVLIAFILMEFPTENRLQQWEEKLENRDIFE